MSYKYFWGLFCLDLIYFVEVLRGVSLCLCDKKGGEGSAPTDSTDITNRGKDKQPPPQPPPNRATSYQAGQKVKKLQKKIFFLQIDSKKNQFSIGGYSTYNI